MKIMKETLYNLLDENITADGTFAIPSEVKYIGNTSFAYCEKLNHIVIPEGVVGINDYAFENCINLKSITLPSTLLEIGEYAFSGCKNLESIIIPENVIKIGRYAFRGCSNLTKINLPNRIRVIKENIFFRCEKLSSVEWHNKLYHIDCIRSLSILLYESQKINLYSPDGSKHQFILSKGKLFPNFKSTCYFIKNEDNTYEWGNTEDDVIRKIKFSFYQQSGLSIFNNLKKKSYVEVYHFYRLMNDAGDLDAKSFCKINKLDINGKYTIESLIELNLKEFDPSIFIKNLKLLNFK